MMRCGRSRAGLVRGARRCGLLALCVLCLGAPGSAVVIATGDGSGNTSAPPDDPGWAAVGLAGGLTGVYLGNGWVLTASHVGERAITFEGVTYQPVVGSKIQMMTSEAYTADLIVYQIEGDPDLPAIVLAQTPPVAGVDQVILIGQGWNREATLTNWTSSFTEAPPGPIVYSGYKRATGRALRWGQDVVTETDRLIALAGHNTHSFLSRFDASGSDVPDEAHAVNGDSGGAVFLKRGGSWELVGILFARTSETDQPVDTAVFGNESVSVDISFYRDQILDATAPPIPVLPLAALTALSGALLVSARAALRSRHTRS